MLLLRNILIFCSIWTSALGVRYRHFDEYLVNLDIREQVIITDRLEMVVEDGSGDDEMPYPSPQPPSGLYLPLRTGLQNSKDVTCCFLGQLAGDKGYHCHAPFYAARIVLRNMNRAHNRKMGFHGRDKVQNYGSKLMRTFDQCVARRGKVFHKCCRLAAMEQSEKPQYDTVQSKRYQKKRQDRIGRATPGF